jgi:RES domain-containing protein
MEKGRTAVMVVPSAVIPGEKNLLLNPAHRDFREIRIGAGRLFRFDERLTSRERR